MIETGNLLSLAMGKRPYRQTVSYLVLNKMLSLRGLVLDDRNR